MRPVLYLSAILLLFTGSAVAECLTRGTGDMGIVIERAAGSLKVVDTTEHKELFRVEGLGDLSHASAVYSRDERYVYIFGRDGGLTKVDILCGQIVKRIVQGGNSIGGAISQDGSLIAVSNYEPGGMKIFSADDLSLFDSGETWIVDMSTPEKPAITKFKDIGSLPYDALITPDGRYYIAGLFGQDGLAMLDLWHPEKGTRLILEDYGKGEQKLPVYKMPHLEGWAMAGDQAFLPGVGRHEVLVVKRGEWNQTGSIPVHGQPVFVMARPDGRQIWVNFAFPHNDTIQVIDTESLEIVKTLKPGKGALHMEFSPRGEEVWISIRDKDEVQVYNTRTFEQTHTLPVNKPSGIFFTARAHQTGL